MLSKTIRTEAARFRAAVTGLLLAATLVAGTAVAQNVAFTGVNVFDGEELLEGMTVVVEDGVITAVGTDVSVPDGIDTVDGNGRTLLPGLIDAHQHVFTPAGLQQSLIFGTTTVLDMFTDPGFAAQMREQQTAGEAADRADLFSAGILATAPGGHGTQFGLPVEGLTSPDQAEAFVAERVEQGADYIKVILESGAEMGMEMPTINQDIATAVIAATHDQGLLAITHVQTLAEARIAVDAGTDGLAHIFTDEVADAEFLDEAAASGLFVIPTMVVFQSLPEGTVDETLINDPNIAPYLAPMDLQSLQQPFGGFELMSAETGIENIRLLHEAGVPILAGTDAMNPGTTYGASLHRELELLVRAGLTPAEALAAATSVPADIFGLDDRGRIAEGLTADLVLVEGDPTEDILASRDIVAVYKHGVEAGRDAWAEGLAAQADAAEAQSAQLSGEQPVLISDFESGDLNVMIGQAWEPTDDQPAGGDSVAAIDIAEGGTADSRYVLQIDGVVGEAFMMPWAGAMYMPAAVPFAPADLSAVPELYFEAAGTPGEYRVQMYCSNLGQQIAEWRFEAHETWHRYDVDLGTISDCDPSGVMAIIFSSGTPGEFTLQLDNVQLRPLDN